MSISKKLKSIFKTAEKQAVKVADVNKDGKVNTKDAKAASSKVAKSAGKATTAAKKKVAPKKKAAPKKK